MAADSICDPPEFSTIWQFDEPAYRIVCWQIANRIAAVSFLIAGIDRRRHQDLRRDCRMGEVGLIGRSLINLDGAGRERTVIRGSDWVRVIVCFGLVEFRIG